MRKDRHIVARFMLVGTAALALAAFTGISKADKTEKADKTDKAADTGTDQQAEGGKLFAKQCSKCHGKEGEGTKKAPTDQGKEAMPLDPQATVKARKNQFPT